MGAAGKAPSGRDIQWVPKDGKKQKGGLDTWMTGSTPRRYSRASEGSLRNADITLHGFLRTLMGMVVEVPPEPAHGPHLTCSGLSPHQLFRILPLML